jgi:nucleotide-binding universal stress UspA family protein
MAIHSVGSPGFRLDEKVKTEISNRIKSMLGRKVKVDKTIDILEGSPLETLVTWVNREKGDLLILGKKKISRGSGILAKMVARKVESSVLFVTEGASPDFKNILVLIDFSNHSLQALQTALAIKANRKEVKITALHVIDFPPTAQYLTRHYGLLAPDWKERVKNAFNTFLERNKLQAGEIIFETVQNSYFNVAQHIMEYAKNRKADAIIMGAKGHSAFDDLFLGSVTEKLVAREIDMPILVVR